MKTLSTQERRWLRFGPTLGVAACSIWIAITGPVAYVVARDVELVTELEMAGPTTFVAGEVGSFTPTTITQQGWTVYAAHVAYEVDGRRYQTISHSATMRVAAGDVVPVEHLVGDPAYARVVGMQRRRRHDRDAWVILVPLLGLAMAAASMRRGRALEALLTRGVRGIGTIVAREDLPTDAPAPTHERVSLLVRWADPEAPGDERETPIDRILRKGKLPEDTSEAACLVDPERPERARVIADLPSYVRMEDDGPRVERPWVWTWPAGAVVTLALAVAFSTFASG